MGRLSSYSFIILFIHNDNDTEVDDHDIDRHREDNGGIALGRDARQSLQIPQLKLLILNHSRNCSFWISFLGLWYWSTFVDTAAEIALSESFSK